MMNNEKTGKKIREALDEGARALKNDCEGYTDARSYAEDLCNDVVSDLRLEDGDYDEAEMRAEAIKAIDRAYGLPPE